MNTPEVDYEEGELFGRKTTTSDEKSDENQKIDEEKRDEEQSSREKLGDKSPEDEDMSPATHDNASSDEYDSWGGYSPKSKNSETQNDDFEAEKCVVPGYDASKYPWYMFNARDLPREDRMTSLKWIAKFLEWRKARGKKDVTRDSEPALRASWSAFYAKALVGGLVEVNHAIEKGQKRSEHDAKYSVSGLKKEIHDLCSENKIVCHILLYENSCRECGLNAYDESQYGKSNDYTRNAVLASKIPRYTSILNERGVNWKANFERNTRARGQERLAKSSNEVPRSHAPAYSHATARGNTSRESPFVDSSKFDPHVRGSIQQSSGFARGNQPTEEVVGEQKSFFFSPGEDYEEEEERDFALQKYDPEEKFHRYQAMVTEKLGRFQKTIETLEKCVGAFAESSKQVSDRCSRLEKELASYRKAQDQVLKTQHLRIQELEGWKAEQRRAAQKRAREEAASAAAPLGPMQTLRKKEGWKIPVPQSDRK